MSVKDVNYLSIMDASKQPLYILNYGDIDESSLKDAIKEDTDTIFIYKEQIGLLHRQDELLVIMVCSKNSNEIFVNNAFLAFISVLNGILKKWTVGRVGEKYDQIVSVVNEFAFNGIIMADNPLKLKERIRPRNFETIGGIQMKKGLAFFIHKATKSLKRK
jgi:hypothetical protein